MIFGTGRMLPASSTSIQIWSQLRIHILFVLLLEYQKSYRRVHPLARMFQRASVSAKSPGLRPVFKVQELKFSNKAPLDVVPTSSSSMTRMRRTGVCNATSKKSVAERSNQHPLGVVSDYVTYGDKSPDLRAPASS